MKKYLMLLLTAVVFLPLCANAQVADSTTTAIVQTTTDSSIVSVAESESVENPDVNRYKAILGQKDVNISFRSVAKGLVGMAVLILIAWAFSTDRRKIAWGSVFRGLMLTATIAYLVLQPAPTLRFGEVMTRLLVTILICVLWTLCGGLKNISIKKSLLSLLVSVPILFILFQFVPVQAVFEFMGKCFTAVLGWTKAGSTFLLGPLMDASKFGFVFAFQILPTIIFFSALTSLLFYLGIIQKVVWALAWALTKALKLSGAESLATAGNIFLGQTESPLMIKAYIPTMNRSEVMLVMTAGMATMAGGVLAAYIQMLGNGDPVLTMEFAKHLLSASVMAAPGAVVISKILVPQTEKIDNKVEVTKEKIGKNLLDAISNGTTEGLKLAANVAAMLLVFYALIAGLNYMFSHTGRVPLPYLASVLGGLVVGLTMGYVLGRSSNKRPLYGYYILIGGLLAVSAAYYLIASPTAVNVPFVTNSWSVLGLLSLSAVLGSLFTRPLIKNGHTKKLHITNGSIALLFIGTVILMLTWTGAGNNLNSIIAVATNGSYSGLSLEFILGYGFSPLMWLIGVCSSDMTLVGQLMGQKLILTEFVGYGELSKLIESGAFVEVKSIIMSTYILCGFANFASIGIQIGGIGSLAPNQKPLLAQFGMRALLGGTLAALVSATMVGIILG